MATPEQKRVQALFRELMDTRKQDFPEEGQELHAPDERGVYVIYSPRGRVVHVGGTPRGKHGIRQRLKNHLHGASSFAEKFLDGKGSKLRHGYTFRCLVVRKIRDRALLEAYTIGQLCPAHIGLGQTRAGH